MKNKLITLICILAIMVTTAIVALANASSSEYVNIEPEPNIGTNLISQNINSGSAEEVSVRQLLPGSQLAKEVTVSNVTQSTPVFVRTVFAFEANGLKTPAQFHNATYILLNQKSDDNTNCYWNWPNDENWMPITVDGEQYYMVVATYSKALPAGTTTEPSLLKIGLTSSVGNEVVDQFGSDYKMFVKTQAVQAEGWKQGNDSIVATTVDVNVISGILDAAFGKITFENHPWKPNGNSTN